jgi:TonB-dependent SusC/RagA subfamily outer membrane receptor
MSSSKQRVLLPAALLPMLLAGCGGRSAPKAEPPPAGAVTAEDIQRTPGEPIEKVLMGRFPGVWITRTADGGISVRIRGGTSLYGSNEPLYIVDDMPIQPRPNGSLEGINPYDIASIEVLKDAASTAMYGVRGANGVIIIRTKRPGQ